nr:MAG TPA: hypothetical protein [Caudoviricetes sp.]
MIIFFSISLLVILFSFSLYPQCTEDLLLKQVILSLVLLYSCSI